MTVHTIVGAGQVGTRLADLLLARGDEVRLVSRTGKGPQAVAADASDVSSLRSATAGSDVIYNCLNPRYHRWPRDWPPMAENLLTCAEAEGAVLVTLSNLYGYGPVAGVMTEQTPVGGHTVKGSVRARMWEQALAAHQQGRVRNVEVRASDYIGEGGGQVMFGDRVVPRIRAGKTVRVLGAADQPHTWTYTGDVATTLAAVARDAATWGRAWHVPSNEPRTQSQVVADLAEALGVVAPAVRPIPVAALRVAGVFSPEIRELREMLYEFDRPFVMDSSAAQNQLGLKPTPWDEVIEETLRRNPA
ncbi:MAG: NAD-dependent epimerase/dehydratase family protein [Candidatus Nanopelagicales bacterium]